MKNSGEETVSFCRDPIRTLEASLSLGTQVNMEILQKEKERISKEGEDSDEEKFLKDLYIFMKNRRTPIERIPHLGFKQLDLFLMFTTVKDLGGYQQVTSQQQWKQVYNVLGGNPRSTSAATCTRRHYEKLLLSYECHLRGEVFNTAPHLQMHYQRHFYGLDNDGPSPAKHKRLPMPLHQVPPHLLTEPQFSVPGLQCDYPPYYHPGHQILPPYLPVPPTVLSSCGPPAIRPQFMYHMSPSRPEEKAPQPLEHLRYLAEQYKFSSGLAEPLNLSVKVPGPELNPKSSFSPPSSSKSPKFLNKPSPLYPSSMAIRNDGSEQDTQDSNASDDDYSPKAPYTCPTLSDPEELTIDLKTSLSSSSAQSSDPTSAGSPSVQVRNREDVSTMSNGPGTMKTKETTEDRERSPEASIKVLELRNPQGNGGEMEIKIPLSALPNWIRLFGWPKQISPPVRQEEELNTHDSSHNLPTNLPMSSREQHRTSATDEIKPRLKRALSPATAFKPLGHPPSAFRYNSYKPSTQHFNLKNSSSKDAFAFGQHDVCNEQHKSKPIEAWAPFHTPSQTAPASLKRGSPPVRAPQQLPSPKSSPYIQNGHESVSSTVYSILNSKPGSELHFSPEEAMKLKKIISSSF